MVKDSFGFSQCLLVPSSKYWIRIEIHHNGFAEQIIDELVAFVEEKHEVYREEKTDQ